MHIWRNGTEFCVLPFDLEVSKLASMRQSREFFPWPRGVATSQCTFVVVVYCLYSLILLLKLQRTSWFDTFPAFYCHQKTIQVVKDMAPINLPFTLSNEMTVYFIAQITHFQPKLPLWRVELKSFSTTVC